MRFPASKALEWIQKRKVSPAYVLLGQQLYWRDRIVAALREVFSKELDESGIIRLDLREDSLIHILQTARERNLLAPRQLLIVANAQTLAGAKRSEELAFYLGNPNPDSVILFEMLDIDLDSADWREKEKVKVRLETFEALCDVILLAAPTPGEAVQLLYEEAAKLDRRISPEASDRLLAAVHFDLGRVARELEKLSLRRPDKAQIEEEDVRELTPDLGAGASLPLAEAIGSGDMAQALEVLAEAEQIGRYAPLVVAEVARYLRQLTLLREQRIRDPRRAGQILWDAKLPASPRALPKLLEQASRLPLTNILKGFGLAHETEIALRSGPPNERLVLERFVVKLMEIFAH